MVGTDKRKTHQGRKQNLLIWYWGRRGGGAHYCLEVARELSKHEEFNVHLSVSRNCDLYAELKALNLPGLDIDTYCDVGSAVMAIPRVSGKSAMLSKIILKSTISTSCSAPCSICGTR